MENDVDGLVSTILFIFKKRYSADSLEFVMSMAILCRVVEED